MTSDCVVGLKRKRRKQAVVGAGMGVLSALGVAMIGKSPASPSTTDTPTAPSTAIPEVYYVYPSAPIKQVPEFEEYEEVMGGISAEDYLEMDPAIDVSKTQQAEKPRQLAAEGSK